MGRKKRRTRKLNGAGSITKLSGHRSKPWIVRGPAEIQIDGTVRRPIIGYFKTSEDAEIALSMYKVKPYNIDEKNTTLGDLYELWLVDKSKEIAPQSLQIYTRAWENHLLHLENRPIRELKYSHYQSVFAGKTKAVTKVIKTILKSLYSIALKNEIVDRDISQTLDISKIEVNKFARTLFDNELVQSIRKISNTDYHKLKETADMVLILLYTGMRSAEIRTVKITDIYLEENYMIGGVKTDAGKNRIIPIHPKIKEIVERYYNENKNYLFEGPKGIHAIGDATFKRRYYQLQEELGFTHNRHSTRHTFITRMQQVGISDGKLKKIVGHKSKDVTDGIYTHYTPEDLLTEIKKLDYDD